MFTKIALATITAAARVAPPSLVHALSGVNGHNLSGLTLNGGESAGREVYVVGERGGGESSTVLTIELPQGHVAR